MHSRGEPQLALNEPFGCGEAAIGIRRRLSPALEPVITNSPLFQLAAARPIGVMALGSLFENRMQYWSGVTNTAKSTFYDLNRFVNYNGQVDFTPFRAARVSWKVWATVSASWLATRNTLEPGERYRLYD